MLAWLAVESCIGIADAIMFALLVRMAVDLGVLKGQRQDARQD